MDKCTKKTIQPTHIFWVDPLSGFYQEVVSIIDIAKHRPTHMGSSGARPVRRFFEKQETTVVQQLLQIAEKKKAGKSTKDRAEKS